MAKNPFLNAKKEKVMKAVLKNKEGKKEAGKSDTKKEGKKENYEEGEPADAENAKEDKAELMGSLSKKVKSFGKK